jgi:hypothetical protein
VKKLPVKISRITIKKNFTILLFIAPLFIYFIPVFLTGNRIFEGDFDMQIQMTEAARKSIIEYHQFPFWNPWVAGGVPLYADPQFGLFTPQTLLSFIVGSVYAWKITFLLYFIVGFFSMKTLLGYLKVEKLHAILLSYIWIFGSFFTLRAFGGHFTFLLFSLLPLLLYLSLRIDDKSPKYWVCFGLLTAYLLNAAFHYSSVMILLVVGIVTVLRIMMDLVSPLKIQLDRDKVVSKLSLVVKRKKLRIVLSRTTLTIRRFAYAAIIVFLLCAPRLYASLSYLHDNSTKREHYEVFIGGKTALRSIACPFDNSDCGKSPNLTFGIFEASNYIGLLTVALFACLMIYYLHTLIVNKSAKLDKTLVPLIALLALSISLGVGGVIFKYYKLLPFVSSMRVSTRWFFITSFVILVIIGLVIKSLSLDNKRKKILNILLCICLAEVLFFGFRLQYRLWVNNKHLLTLSVSEPISDVVKQDRFYNTTPSTVGGYMALTQATLNNHGQIIADNALVDTRLLPTQRCDHDDDKDCGYILTRNAEVVYWSPNEIVLRRTAVGEIKINSNHGYDWFAGKTRIGRGLNVAGADSTMAIPSNIGSINEEIILRYKTTLPL